MAVCVAPDLKSLVKRLTPSSVRHMHACVTPLMAAQKHDQKLCDLANISQCIEEGRTV